MEWNKISEAIDMKSNWVKPIEIRNLLGLVAFSAR
jgi:hypothetical protein